MSAEVFRFSLFCLVFTALLSELHSFSIRPSTRTSSSTTPSFRRPETFSSRRIATSGRIASTASAVSSVEEEEASSEEEEGLSRDERLRQETDKANKLRVGELKEKLQSMGVNTKTFLEKSEFVKALAEAIVDGVKEKPRSERLDEEYRKANEMAIHDLIDGLLSMGVDTRSFNVKSEFAWAYAQAKVDGIRKPTPEEVAKSQEFDPSYRDVELRKIDSADMRLHEGTLIDIPLKL